MGRYLRADPIGIIEFDKGFLQSNVNANTCKALSYFSKQINHLYAYVQNNPIKYQDPKGLALNCPDGQHLVKDLAGFGNCMASGPALVFCPVCAAAAYYAPTGYGIPVGIAACVICLAEEIRCMDENSRCECD